MCVCVSHNVILISSSVLTSKWVGLVDPGLGLRLQNYLLAKNADDPRLTIIQMK